MSRSDYLFCQGDLSQGLQNQTRLVGEAAQQIAPDHALGRSVEELAQELVDRFRVECLDVDWDGMTLSHKDEQINVSGTFGPINVPGTRFTYHIPFRGEADLFKAQPSSFTMNPPRARIAGDEILVSVTARTPISDGVKNELDREVEKIRDYVGWVNRDVDAFNAGLLNVARSAVQVRRDKVKADQDLVASFGVPVRRREDATPTYATTSVRRKVTPAVAPRGSKPSAPEPVLSAEQYEDILSIVRGMALTLERSPKAFAGMDEESIRMHFLVPLNGQFEGSATGETFNFEGKTDILIRDRNRTIFIAECKFWRGPKVLTETIDQILRYTSWRETKTAILLFNRNRDLTKVLEQIVPTVKGHPSFIREIEYGGETEFRFVLHHTDDELRELTLTVMVFEVPE